MKNWIRENKENPNEMFEIRNDGKNIIEIRNLHSISHCLSSNKAKNWGSP